MLYNIATGNWLPWVIIVTAAHCAVICHPLSRTDHLPSPAHVSGTACQLVFVIRHCPREHLQHCWKLTCFCNGRGAGVFELAPLKCRLQYDMIWYRTASRYTITPIRNMSHKKQNTFIFVITFANIYRFSYFFFTTIFSTEFRNKNLLKFSPHLKSVTALPCTVWTVKCQMSNCTTFYL